VNWLLASAWRAVNSASGGSLAVPAVRELAPVLVYPHHPAPISRIVGNDASAKRSITYGASRANFSS